MKRLGMVAMIFLFAIMFAVAGISKPASASIWHPAEKAEKQIKVTDKKVAKVNERVDWLDGRIENITKALDGMEGKIAKVQENCTKCGDQPTKPAENDKDKSKSKAAPALKKPTAVPKAKKSALKSSAPSVPFPKGEYGHAITDNTNVSLDTLAEMRWAKTEDGLRTAIFCTTAYGGLKVVSYDKSQEEFKDGCIAFVYNNARTYSFLTSEDLRELASLYASQEVTRINGDKTRVIVAAEGTETRSTIVSSALEIINDNKAQTIELKEAIFTVGKLEKADQAADRVWSSFAALQTNKTSVALQDQFCDAVASNLLVIRNDSEIYAYYNSGYIDFLIKNGEVCVNPTPKKKKKFHLGIFTPLAKFITNGVNTIAKMTVKPITHGLCINEGHSPDCKPDAGQVLLGGISTYALGRVVLSPWALDHLGWKDKGTIAGHHGGGGNGPVQPSPQTTNGSPGNGQDGGGYSGTVNGTTGNQNYANPPGSQVPSSSGTPPPMQNGAVDLPGQLVQGASGTPSFTPITGRSTLRKINDSHGPDTPSIKDFGSAF